MKYHCELNSLLEYPANLIDSLNQRYNLGAETLLSEDQLEGLGVALSSLSDQERETIRLRFEEKLSLDSIGKAYGNMTREGVRKIEERALRKLSKPEAAQWFIMGKKFCLEHIEETESTTSLALEEIIPTMDISLLPLSNRTANSLKKKGIFTAEDLFSLPMCEITELHMGEGTMRELFYLLNNAPYARTIRRDSLLQRIEDSNLSSDDKYAIKNGLIELQSLRAKQQNNE